MEKLLIEFIIEQIIYQTIVALIIYFLTNKIGFNKLSKPMMCLVAFIYVFYIATIWKYLFCFMSILLKFYNISNL